MSGKKQVHKALQRRIALHTLIPYIPDMLDADADRRLGDAYILTISGTDFVEPNEFYKPQTAEELFPQKFTLLPPEELLTQKE